MSFPWLRSLAFPGPTPVETRAGDQAGLRPPVGSPSDAPGPRPVRPPFADHAGSADLVEHEPSNEELHFAGRLYTNPDDLGAARDLRRLALSGDRAAALLALVARYAQAEALLDRIRP